MLETTKPTRAIISVSDLNKRAKKILETELSSIWVCGEISTLSKPNSGHWYFTLKDQGAQVRCAMFANANQRCRIEPQQGTQVIVLGKVSIYEGRGDYQLIVESMEASGVGALHQAYEQLKRRLYAEGLFNPANKLPLPQYPQRIALITSATGAAIADLIHVFKRRAASIELVVLPSIVQGDKAAASLLAMLDQAIQLHTAKTIDLIIIGRGGGSLEDLWAFNDEELARKLVECPIPSISAVGHEIDHSISDYAASFTAATPSAAAEIASQHWVTLANAIAHLKGQLVQSQTQRILAKVDLVQKLTNALIDPKSKLREHYQRLDIINEQLHQLMEYRFQQTQLKLNHLRALLEAVAPNQVLKRGYSILKNANNQLVTSVSELSTGDKVKAQLSDGVVDLEVIK